ncbi:hypothetical protein [Maritimibacter sp. DP1N21-5]|uniref:portal protein n=1 Tax=Maritimibacter sp. DP1N21-5 TaxID=2836867 RepID=UPI001C46092F|nr:hypothetical protein [Maritimibacter sp. DP1N21-5]MBV7408759.1 hypothetical protein [Maritimibacter sp. DP1N21-5]
MYDTDQDPHAARSIALMNRPQGRTELPEDRVLSRPAEAAMRHSTPIKANKLDSPQVQGLHRRFLGLYLAELDRQSEGRASMASDEAFYHGHHWTPEDLATLDERGQLPLTFNVTATSINYLLGTERRGRTDYKILPRRKEGAAAAESKTQLLKYIADQNRTEFEWSQAFAECVTAGLGWMESGVQDDSEGEPIYEGSESWRNMIFDSAAKKMDLSDGRYKFRTAWVDLDIAKARFRNRAGVLRHSATRNLTIGILGTLDGFGDDAMDERERFVQEGAFGSYIAGGYSEDRDRVRLIECWFKLPAEEKIMKGGQFAGEIFDEGSIGHYVDLQTGGASIIRKTILRTYVMIMTDDGVLWLSKSPYRHNRYPFTPIWCYRDSTNGMPYGFVRNVKSNNMDINKRATKALHLISTARIIVDDDAVKPDGWEAFEEEAHRPDAIIRIKPGAKLEYVEGGQQAKEQLMLMSEGVNMIQSITGITDEAMGRTTNAVSGKAIIARQEQGALATAPVFDNLRFARQVHGEKMLALTEQFVTEQKEFRVTNKRGAATFITINEQNADGILDDWIARTKADYIISEDDWNATIRASQADEFMELLLKLAPVAPEMVINLLDLMVEMLDTPQREETVKRIRAMTGAKDPDADPNAPPTPEEAARMAAADKEAQMAERAANAEIGKMEAEAAVKIAQAQKTAIELVRIMTGAENDAVTKQKAALELANLALSSPSAVSIADQVMMEARAEIAAHLAPPQQPQSQPQPTM